MKKLFTLLITILCVYTLFAQEFQKNIIGIRGGLNMANMTSHGILATNRNTFLFGISEQVRITKSIPLYIETGAYLAGKGYRIKGYNDSKTKLLYVQIPIMVNYHLYLNDDIYFEPHLGFYYSYGIHSKRKYEGKKIDVFENGEMKTSDVGICTGLGFTIQKFHMGVKYEIGFFDIAKNNVSANYKQKLGYDKLHNKCLSIYIGSNF